MKEQDAPVDVAEKTKEIPLIDKDLLKSKVYTIRGVKVMLNGDLAEIYGYSVKAFNQQVKNNILKFPDDFRFQLSPIDVEALSRSNFLTSMQVKGVKGGKSYLPYAFTEQGVYMLMTVLKGDLAVRQSPALVRIFKEMKDYIAAENQQLLGCASCAQNAPLTAQNTREIAVMRSDYEVLKIRTGVLESESAENRESLVKIMENFTDPSTFKHFAILDGHKFEADVANTRIYSLAKRSIIVIDNYLDIKTLDLLRCGWCEGDNLERPVRRVSPDASDDSRLRGCPSWRFPRHKARQQQIPRPLHRAGFRDG